MKSSCQVFFAFLALFCYNCAGKIRTLKKERKVEMDIAVPMHSPPEGEHWLVAQRDVITRKREYYVVSATDAEEARGLLVEREGDFYVDEEEVEELLIGQFSEPKLLEA